MQRIPKWLKIGAGITLALVIALTAYFFTTRGQASAAAGQQFQTSVVERTSLISTISATGSVRSNQSAILMWQANAKVGEVKIKLGQKVQKDDILAVLDPATLPQNLIQAQSDLIRAQDALQDLYDQHAGKRAAAEKTLAQAQKTLEDAERERSWMNNNTRADKYAIQKAEADYYLALNQVTNAQETFDSTSVLDVDSAVRAQAQSNLAAAQSNAQQKKWMLDYYRGRPTQTEIAEKEAALQVAKAALDDAQRQYALVKDGPEEKDITLAKKNVTMAEAANNQTRLSAPFSGTITSLNAKSGDIVTPNTVGLRIDDLSTLFVDAEVSEVDINHIQVGQTATITLDAVPNKSYTGEVSEVGTAGSSVAGAVNFPVTIRIRELDRDVKPGMTAGAVITAAQLDNVLVVPSRAVRTVSGKRVVFVLDSENALHPVVVELGAVAESMVEISGGELKEGDVIVLNPPADSLQMKPGGARRMMNP